jgi:hypothetical protein
VWRVAEPSLPQRHPRGSYGRHPPRAVFPARVLPSRRVAFVELVPGSRRARDGPGSPRAWGAAAHWGTASPAPGDAHGGCLDRVAAAHAPHRMVGPGGRLGPPGAPRVLSSVAGPHGSARAGGAMRSARAPCQGVPDRRTHGGASHACCGYGSRGGVWGVPWGHTHGVRERCRPRLGG